MASGRIKSFWWCAFLIGLVCAGIGIAELHVEISVFGLIAASTAGLNLLKLRAQALGRLEVIDGMKESAPPVLPTRGRAAA